MAAVDIHPLLLRSKLFSALDEDERVEIASLLRPFRASRGEVIHHDGAADCVYLFVEGRAQVTARLPFEDKLVTGECGPGDVLGELALNGPMSRYSTLTALEDTAGYTLAIDDFAALRRQFRPAARKVLYGLSNLLASRLREMSRQISGMAVPVEGEILSDSGAKSRTLGSFGPPHYPSAEVRQFLRILPLFRHFDADELSRFADMLLEWEVPRGGVIFEEGALGSSMFVVVRGAIEVSQRSTTRRVHLSVAGPGATVGMVPMVDRGPRRTTCVAREHAVVLELEQRVFSDLFASDDRIASKLVEAINTNLIASLQQIHAELIRRATHADFDRMMPGASGTALDRELPTLAARGLPASALIDIPRSLVSTEDAESPETDVHSRWEQFHKDALLERVRRSVIGDDAVIGGPFGLRRIV